MKKVKILVAVFLGKIKMCFDRAFGVFITIYP